jgi:CP family cyanate transporter-like MFS transporter
VLGWLPQILVDAGVARTAAGVYTALISMVGFVVSLFGVPIFARMRNQSAISAGLAALTAVAIIGLVVAPAGGSLAWALILGVGMSTFPITLLIFALRTRTPAETTALSTMAQGIGYLMAATGPILFGLLKNATGTWTIALLVLLAAIAVEAVTGWLSGRDEYV